MADAHRCPACRDTMRLLEVSGQQVDQCRACGSVWFDTGELDALLGGTPEIRLDDEQTAHRCPVCELTLTPGRFEDCHAEVCTTCAGALFRPKELRALADHGATFATTPRAAPKADALRACPGCSAKMQVFFAEGVEIDRCFFCGGFWFDEGELERVVGEDLPVEVGTTVTARKCAYCETAMARAHFEELELEHCTACAGTYLDDGELRELAGREVPLARPEEPLDFEPDQVTFRCGGCGEHRPIHEGLIVGSGMACPRCYPALAFGGQTAVQVHVGAAIGTTVAAFSAYRAMKRMYPSKTMRPIRELLHELAMVDDDT